MASPTATDGPDPTTPLWRAAQVYRLLSCVYALGFQMAVNSDLRHPALGWLLFAVLIGWSAACALAYLRGFGRRPAWVIAEIVVVVLLVLSTLAVASRQWELDNQTWPTTLWATNATVSAALQFGPAAATATPAAIPATGPNCRAAETVALVAHNVVGQVWLSSSHCRDATAKVDSTSRTTTTISAITQAGLRPNPRR
jgi:hypothetical protein